MLEFFLSSGEFKCDSIEFVLNIELRPPGSDAIACVLAGRGLDSFDRFKLDVQSLVTETLCSR